MSTLQTYNLKHPDASGNQITLASGGNLNITGATAITGATDITGDLEVAGDVQTTGRFLLGTTSTGGASTYYDDLIISNTASGTGAGITFFANATDGFSAIDFADTDAIGRGRITYGHDSDRMMIDVAGSELCRITDEYGVTGAPVERFFPCQAKYYNGTATVDSGSFFYGLSNVPSISASGAAIYFVFPTCIGHRNVISAKLIYGATGNASGTPWTVDGQMYRASSGQGYTSDNATFSNDLISSVFNGKIYETTLTNFPTLQEDHINSLKLTFTENVNGTTLGIYGLQLCEGTRAR